MTFYIPVIEFKHIMNKQSAKIYLPAPPPGRGEGTPLDSTHATSVGVLALILRAWMPPGAISFAKSA